VNGTDAKECMANEHAGRGGNTVERILDAATNVFSEFGFAGARVDEIARRAGVNKATLYYHIGDKKALYAEVIHRVIGTAAKMLLDGIKGSRKPEDKMKTYLKTLAKTFDNNPQMPRIMMRELASGGKNLPEVFFQDLFSIFRTLSGIIEEGKTTGVFIDTLPLMVHFMAIGATIIYKTMAPILLSVQQVPDELKGLDGDVSGMIAEEIEKLILRAIKK
jgi:AcrR family transcriptional regulator